MASRTRMLCEGAMMCALTALLLLINRVAGGMIETAFPWLLVFPLLVYCARYGVRAALICCVSILLLSLCEGAPQTAACCCAPGSSAFFPTC